MMNQGIVDTVQDIGADVAMVQDLLDLLDLLVLEVLDPVLVLKEVVDVKDKVNHVCK